MRITSQSISRNELNAMLPGYFGDMWGINLYPEMDGDDFIEFDSLINIRN